LLNIYFEDLNFYYRYYTYFVANKFDLLLECLQDKEEQEAGVPSFIEDEQVDGISLSSDIKLVNELEIKLRDFARARLNFLGYIRVSLCGRLNMDYLKSLETKAQLVVPFSYALIEFKLFINTLIICIIIFNITMYFSNFEFVHAKKTFPPKQHSSYDTTNWKNNNKIFVGLIIYKTVIRRFPYSK